MAKNGFKVFDSDMHVLEPVDLWERYIDPAFRDRAPRGSTHTPMDVGVVVGGENAFRLSAAIAKVSFKGGLGRFADDIARGFDAKAQLQAMDREGIDVTVLYPSRGLFVNSGFHEGVAANVPTVGTDRFADDNFSLQHACSHSMEQMLAVEAMTLGGVLARFPRLKVAFLEGNGSWLPFWLWRLDEHWENPGRYEDPTITERPSEYFARQGFVSIECDEEPARHAVEGRAADCFVFSTDYPHYDTKYPEATAHFLKLPLGEESKRKILWDNCARLYGF